MSKKGKNRNKGTDEGMTTKEALLAQGFSPDMAEIPTQISRPGKVLFTIKGTSILIKIEEVSAIIDKTSWDELKTFVDKQFALVESKTPERKEAPNGSEE